MQIDIVDAAGGSPAQRQTASAWDGSVTLKGPGVSNTSNGLLIQARRNSVGISESTTPLGSGATFTGGDRLVDSDSQGFAYFTAEATADQAGTLFVEKSNDAVTWYPSNGLGTALTAGGTATVKTPIVARHMRARFVNGGVAQGSFSLFCNQFVA